MTATFDAASDAWPRRPARLGIAVLATLADQIVGGELPEGSTLPTEPALCARFGVSRTVIRESLKLLEEKGLVRVKQGQGTTVVSKEQWNLLDPIVLDAAIRRDATLDTLDHVIDVRVSLESQMARRTAAKITDEQLDALHHRLVDLGQLIRQPLRYGAADADFHDEISRLSGNQLGRSIIRSVHPYARRDGRYNDRDLYTPETLERSHRGHIHIYEQIARHDPDAAAIAVAEHILGSWLRWREVLTLNKTAP